MQLPTRNCNHCQKPFQPHQKQQKYCDKQCRANNYYRRYHKVNKPRVCPQCKKHIPPESNLTKKFCSSKCRQRYHYEQQQGYVDAQGNPTATSPQSTAQKREQIIPTIRASIAPLKAGEILERVGLPDNDANRRDLLRRVKACPEIETSGENKDKRYYPEGLAVQADTPVEPSSPPPDVQNTGLKEAIEDLCGRIYSGVQVDYDTLNSLIEDPSATLTDEIKACFRAGTTSTIITASYVETTDITSLLPRLTADFERAEVPLAWEFGGDLVFIVSDRCPENQALRLREILHGAAPDKSIRLRRGNAWGRNDWKFNGYMYTRHDPPIEWDESWWTD